MGTINSKDYEARLIRHIDALDVAYENIITILEEKIEMKKDEKTEIETVKLNDDKIKTYAEGILKASETADKLLGQIKLKQDELFKIQNPVSEKSNKDLKDENTSEGSAMNKHLS